MKDKKTPDGERLERTLPFKLNDEDKARKGELAATLNKQLEVAIEAKKAEVSKHNAKITHLTKQVSAQLKMINEGIERKAVTCTMVKNFESNKLEYWFEGIILEETEMKPDDRQLALKPDEKKAKKKFQKTSAQDQMFPNAETREAEIASVHRMETSKRGANSAVDPR